MFFLFIVITKDYYLLASLIARSRLQFSYYERSSSQSTINKCQRKKTRKPISYHRADDNINNGPFWLLSRARVVVVVVETFEIRCAFYVRCVELLPEIRICKWGLSPPTDSFWKRRNLPSQRQTVNAKRVACWSRANDLWSTSGESTNENRWKFFLV